MSKDSNEQALTRRAFIRAMGIGGAAAATLTASQLGLAAESQPPAKASAMPRRRLGRTGIDVSILSLGGMFDTITNQLLLKQAFNWGVTHWDTAEAYGNGMSEEGFGRYFSRNPDARKDIFLVTKLTPKGGNFNERFEKALKRLQTNYVDTFFVHGISDINDVDGGMKKWAAEMKKAGKMKFFGFSAHNNMENLLLSAARDTWADVIMITYNYRLMHTSRMMEAVAACAKAGIGLVAMKTQGGGPVTKDGDAKLNMASTFMERGFTDAQAKLKAVWEEKNISSICSQMPNMNILSANVAAARDLTRLSRAEWDSIRAYAAETHQDYCAGCTAICSAAVGGRVPIGDVMRCLMYYRAYGEMDLAKEVYASLEGEMDGMNRINFKTAENACPRRLEIGRLMREAAEILV